MIVLCCVEWKEGRNCLGNETGQERKESGRSENTSGDMKELVQVWLNKRVIAPVVGSMGSTKIGVRHFFDLSIICFFIRPLLVGLSKYVCGSDAYVLISHKVRA